MYQITKQFLIFRKIKIILPFKYSQMGVSVYAYKHKYTQKYRLFIQVYMYDVREIKFYLIQMLI